MKRGIAVFYIESEDPLGIGEEILKNFPAFLEKCSDEKKIFKLSYSKLGNARFELKHDMNIRDFISSTFLAPKVKHNRRKLGIPKNGDT